jgi:hypothetical protein
MELELFSTSCSSRSSNNPTFMFYIIYLQVYLTVMNITTSEGFTPVGAMLSSPTSPLFPTVENSSTSVVHDRGFVPVDTVISARPRVACHVTAEHGHGPD